MSHLPVRKEKVCLNCHADLHGRYCHECGQENLEPKETFWHLLTHFAYDVTHFDGKFFSSLKLLLFRPGFLSREYGAGRRAAYLNPIRMYVFTSAFFFIIFFSFVSSPVQINRQSGVAQYETQRVTLLQKIRTEHDSTGRAGLEKKLVKLDTLIQKYKSGRIDTTGEKIIGLGGLPDRLTSYDSGQLKLQANRRDGWFKHRMKHRFIEINQKYKGKTDEFIEKLIEKFLHSFPQMLFLSVPLTALILQLLYLRRKQFYYVNHVIFILHVYIAAFIFLLFYYSIGGLQGVTGWGLFTWLKLAVVMFMFFYVYKAMRNFYLQRRAKTVVKFLLFNLTTLLLTIIITAIFFITSFMQI